MYYKKTICSKTIKLIKTINKNYKVIHKSSLRKDKIDNC